MRLACKRAGGTHRCGVDPVDARRAAEEREIEKRVRETERETAAAPGLRSGSEVRRWIRESQRNVFSCEKRFGLLVNH